MNIKQIIFFPIFFCFFSMSIAQTAQLEGTISNPIGSPMANVMVELVTPGESNQTTTTDDAGKYTFTATTGKTYTINCFFEGANPLNGVSTFDLVLGLQDIIHVRAITDPLFRVAADVNSSGSVSVADMWKMRQMILGVDTSWDRPDWVFVATSTNDISGIEDPISAFQIELVDNQTGIDFTGIKTGDLNGNSYE